MPANRAFDFPVSTRNRYLLDEIPPRTGANAGDKSGTPPAP